MSKYGFGSATHTVGSVTTSSGTVLAANVNREYAAFINDSDTVIYLALGGAAAVNAGIRLNPNGGCAELTKGAGNLYTGRVEAIHGGSGTKVMTVTEGV